MDDLESKTRAVNEAARAALAKAKGAAALEPHNISQALAGGCTGWGGGGVIDASHAASCAARAADRMASAAVHDSSRRAPLPSKAPGGGASPVSEEAWHLQCAAPGQTRHRLGQQRQATSTTPPEDAGDLTKLTDPYFPFEDAVDVWVSPYRQWTGLETSAST